MEEFMVWLADNGVNLTPAQLVVAKRLFEIPPGKGKSYVLRLLVQWDRDRQSKGETMAPNPKSY